jgi:hypothetical protein
MGHESHAPYGVTVFGTGEWAFNGPLEQFLYVFWRDVVRDPLS